MKEGEWRACGSIVIKIIIQRLWYQDIQEKFCYSTAGCFEKFKSLEIDSDQA